jgi:hypothetical protein
MAMTMNDGAAPAPVRRRPRFRFRLSLRTMMVAVLVIGTGLGWLARSRRDDFEGQLIRAELALARAELKNAEDRLAWSDRMHQKGYVSKSQNTADRLTLQQRAFAVEQAEARQSRFIKWFGE